MKVIQMELTEAIADLAAKCPGARLGVAVHNAPFEVFAADDVTNVAVITGDERTWLHGRAKGAGYDVDFYSVDLPQAVAPEQADADVIPL